jgi:hypothetical protein
MASDFRGRLTNGRREQILDEAKGTAREIASTQPWSTRTRVVAAGVGGGLIFLGLRRTSLPGLAVTAFGLGLAARALTNFRLGEGAGADVTESDYARGRAVPGDTVAPNASDLRDLAAEEEMTAFTENPGSIPSD